VIEKTIMPFGKYKGQRFEEIPLSYLDWMLGQDIRDPLRRQLTEYLSKPTIQRLLDEELERNSR